MQKQKRALICGAGGFIGSHLAKRLKKEGYWVKGVDLKYPEYSATAADEFIIGDLREYAVCDKVVDESLDEIYQLAADMGGAGYIFTGEHDADVMHNSATINLNILDLVKKKHIKKIFYSSSACIYPLYNQLDPSNPKCSEGSAYPATRETTDYRFALPVFIIFSDLKVPGTTARKNLLQPCVEKSLKLKMAEQLMYGATGNKHGLSYILMNAWKGSGGLWNQNTMSL
jgi:hypothetical protein